MTQYSELYSIQGNNMKLEITHEKLEEIVLCIVQCNLNEEEALEYANAVMLEFNEGVGLKFTKPILKWWRVDCE